MPLTEIHVPSPFRSRHARQLASLVTLALLVLLSGTAASVIVAGDVPRRVARMQPTPPFDLDAYRTRNAIRTAIDSLVAPLGPATTIDDTLLKRIVAMTRSTSAEGVWTDVGNAAQPGDTADLMLFRRFARSNPFPILWGYRAGLASTTVGRHLPNRRLLPMRRLHDANAASADSALAAGNPSLALTRARENLAVARHYLDQPIAIDLLVARMFLIRGAELLQRAAYEAAEPSTVTAAKQLESLVKRSFVSAPLSSRLYRYGRDARSQQLLALASDRSVHSSLRLATLEGVIEGACLSTREMLFGVSRDRYRLFEQLATAVSDIPRADELVPLYRRDLSSFDDASVESLVAAGISRRLFVRSTAFDQVVPTAVRARAAYCRAEL